MDTCQFRTYLHARIPRIDCPEHGVLQVKVPWAEPRSRVTLLFECFVIDVIAQCANIQGVCRLLRLNWDEVWGVMNRAVARELDRKQERVIPALAIDEKAFKKGHKYMTVVCDLERATVEHVAEDRKAESLQAFWKGLSSEQLDGVEAVSMDMDAVAETVRFIDGLAPTATASMQRDIAEGRPSELEEQNGAVVRLGRARGVPTPAHELLYAALLPRERRARSG